MPKHLPKKLLAAALAFSMYACTGQNDVVISVDDDSRIQDAVKLGDDVQSALAELQDAEVLAIGAAGVPTFIRGELGRATTSLDGFGKADTHNAIRPHLDRIAAAFRVNANDLVVRSLFTDELGSTHVRYQQTKDGLKVVGAELIVHVDNQGVIYAANGEARDGVGLSSEAKVAGVTAQSVARAALADLVQLTVGEPALVYYRHSQDGSLQLAYQVEVSGQKQSGAEARELVYVNARNGAVIEKLPQIHEALNRALYSANNGSSLPGTLKRSEGGAATGDTHVDENYAHLGTTYNCYSSLFTRDSYNNAGAQLRSTVHYSSNYVNAYWNGTQMVYGDGNGVDAGPLGKDLDVTVHELTHAVTDSESDLVYANESGALNEGMSDIFAAVCESWSRLSMGVDADVWKIGEDIWTPATAGDALRYMANPTQDGSSKDYYPERYTGTQDNGGVHWNSGIFNLWFKLLVTGGTHPRAKTTVNVAGIGMTQAAQITYRAQTTYMTSSTNFAAARTHTVQAATDLYGAAAAASVGQAWDAVGVGTGGGGGGGTVTALTDGVAKTGLSASSGTQTHYKITVPAGQSQLKIDLSGGTGDADMYVKQGSQPTTTSYTCRPYKSGNVENCTFTNPVAGDWFIMLNAYSSYSNASLIADYSATTPPAGDPYLTNGTAVTGISGAASSQQYWRLAVPAGKTSVTFTLSGGTGDADLYVRSGARPTTSTYNCRPYKSGNEEVCTLTNPTAGDWYVMVRGYTSFSGVSLKGQY